MIKLKQLGRHILIEYYDCDRKVLENSSLIEKYMLSAAKLAKATIVESVFHTFNPWGISGVVVIEESHLTIHTWPEYKYAAVDLFTCGNTIKPWTAFEFLEEKLSAKRTDITEIPRGVMDCIFKNQETFENS
ncbi:adenosylmethionine decarboxylase [Anaerosalibacter massiliensis]|uniref:S-adenosylmethionine decarboxylase proenzyme n=1 Tax=Anaerosalibacter massiliensis TaxID=1347392 RepID=A0A9X2MG76_9FIRM|nr:adenosylmethionine decarboxylase [Anaerosalibacter massiliensis]MCR2043428.1 adenosylmethionine decarboxylase [Anaerosalibacter massiliensis]